MEAHSSLVTSFPNLRKITVLNMFSILRTTRKVTVCEAVKTVKTLIKKCKMSGEDPYAALLNHRSTPIKNRYSPAELVMGWKLRTKVPILSSELDPGIVDH